MQYPRVQTALLGTGLLLACVGLLRNPQVVAACVQTTLLRFVNVLLPALFPFFIISSLVIQLGIAQSLGRRMEPLTQTLFHLNGACASILILGLIGGYPAGANAAAALYQSGQCSKEDTQRLLAFCNNCGPAFLVGVVGTTLFQDIRLGLLLNLVHLVSALLVGILLCPSQRQPTASVPKAIASSPSFSEAFVHSVTDSFQSLLNICAFFICFSVLLELMTQAGLSGLWSRLLMPLLPFPGSTLEALFQGMFELTSGVLALTEGALLHRLIFSSFLLGWGGWSIHFQTLSLLSSTDLSPKLYLSGKMMHAWLSALLMAGLLIPILRLPIVLGITIVIVLFRFVGLPTKNAIEHI